MMKNKIIKIRRQWKKTFKMIKVSKQKLKEKRNGK